MDNWRCICGGRILFVHVVEDELDGSSVGRNVKHPFCQTCRRSGYDQQVKQKPAEEVKPIFVFKHKVPTP